MKKGKSIIIAAVAIVVIFSLFFLIKGMTDKSASVTSLDGSFQLAQFTHGIISCEMSNTVAVESAAIQYTGAADYSCMNTFKVTTDQCDLKMKLLQPIYFSRNINYEVCDIVPSTSDSLYTSTNYQNCVPGTLNTNNIFESGYKGGLFTRDQTGAVYDLRLSLPANKVFRVKKIQSSALLSGEDKSGLFSMFIQYKPYGIYRTDILNGNGWIQKENCIAVPTDVQKNMVISATESGIYTNLFDKQNFMYANEKIDYLSQPVLIPFSTSKLKQINGVYGYCQAKTTIAGSAYFGIESVTAFNLYKYYYVTSKILQDNVECCNGDVTVGKVCQNEKWVSDTTELQCSAAQPCPIQFDTRYGDKQVYHQTCSNGKCINAITTVECTSSADCLQKTGGICRADFTCYYRASGCSVNSDCLNGQECLNAVCTDQKNSSYMWWIVGALVLIIVIIIAVLIAKKNGGSTTF